MSSSPQDLIPQLDIGTTFGALFIGVTIAAVLFGLSNIQAFIYFQTHKDTGILFFNLAVIWLWILDALHLALIVHCVYYYLVINYANVNALMEIVWSFKLQIIVDAFIIPSAHLFYGYRIWIISKGRSRILPIIVCIIITIHSGVAIALIWALYQCHVFPDLIKLQWGTYVALGLTTFADIVIASSMCYLLATSRTGVSSTDSLITKLMAYIINTGCLTSICSVTAMITCIVMPTNFIFLAMEFLLVKLYVNSFLALMNARYYARANAGTDNFYLPNSYHGVYRPGIHTRALEDEELQASRKDVFKYLHDESVHPSRSVKPQESIAVTTTTMEMNDFSSV
ncbi:hypothetical protein BDR07DRAFT_1439264 [Suillus spraguei]|nr:hypothetical protein BDR07DRAFT_1439264 [Suillus spraguei]